MVVTLCLLLNPAASLAGEWELARRDEPRDIRTYVRDLPGTRYKAFYATTRVKASLSSVVAVLSDVHAMPEWVARMRSARLLRREANRDVWFHGVYQLPYPFVEREAVLHSTLTQKRSGIVEVETRAIRGMVGTDPKRVRLTNMRSLWRLTPERDGIVKIELWGEGDPGGHVPPLLFNYNLPDEPLQTLRNLRQMLTRDKYRTRKLDYVRDS